MGSKKLTEGARERVRRRRRRHMFRQKRGLGSRIFWPIVGVLVVAGLIWFMPWPLLDWVAGEDASEIEASKDEPEQVSTEDQPEQSSTEEQPEQEEIIEDPPKDEDVAEDTPSSSPPKEEGSSSSVLYPSPVPVQ